jgi:hypothetical protein
MTIILQNWFNLKLNLPLFFLILQQVWALLSPLDHFHLKYQYIAASAFIAAKMEDAVGTESVQVILTSPSGRQIVGVVTSSPESNIDFQYKSNSLSKFRY